MQAVLGIYMKTGDFNSEAGPARFTYRPSPVHARSFQILKYQEDKARDPQPVGEYTVLDSKEDSGLSEKKVMNMVSLLNGRKNLMQLGHETGVRVLYHVITECDDEGMTRVMFYNLGKEGVSVENALFRIERGEYVH